MVDKKARMVSKSWGAPSQFSSAARVSLLIKEWVMQIRAILDVKDYFEERIGHSVYQLLPGVVENTFGFPQNGKDLSHGKY